MYLFIYYLVSERNAYKRLTTKYLPKDKCAQCRCKEYTGAKASQKQYNWAIKQQSQGSFLNMFNVFQTLISSVILLEINARALVSIIFVKI